MPDRGVFDVGLVGAKRAHYHFAGVDSHTRLDRWAACFPQAGRVPAHALLHEQRGVERTLGMILLGGGRTKQGEDTIAGRLHNVAVVMMNGVDHQLKRRINDRARFLPGRGLLAVRSNP